MVKNKKYLTNKLSYIIIITERKKRGVHTMTINVSEREFELIIKALNKLNTQEADDLIDKLEDNR